MLSNCGAEMQFLKCKPKAEKYKIWTGYVGYEYTMDCIHSLLSNIKNMDIE